MVLVRKTMKLGVEKMGKGKRDEAKEKKRP